MREIVIDTETTGLDPLDAHGVVEIGAAELVNRSPTGQTFHRYVCPERTMPADALAMHGLSAEFLADKPLFGVVADEFLASSAMRCSWPTTRALALPLSMLR
jgi:DNA polymerase III subunit epsilon